MNRDQIKKWTTIVWVLVVGVFIMNVFLGVTLQKVTTSQKRVSPSPTAALVKAAPVSYQGVEGKDALSLLKEKNTIAQNKSGLVTSINGYTAKDTNHEYWAFYVNGKLSQVGAAEYQTQEGDTLEWKIEKY